MRTGTDIQLIDPNTGDPINPATEDTLSSLLVSNLDYAVRIDEASSTVTYFGFAAPGSAEASAVWRIFRVTTTSSTLTKEYADGNRNFDNKWSERVTPITYS